MEEEDYLQVIAKSEGRQGYLYKPAQLQRRDEEDAAAAAAAAATTTEAATRDIFGAVPTRVVLWR